MAATLFHSYISISIGVFLNLFSYSFLSLFIYFSTSTSIYLSWEYLPVHHICIFLKISLSIMKYPSFPSVHVKRPSSKACFYSWQWTVSTINRGILSSEVTLINQELDFKSQKWSEAEYKRRLQTMPFSLFYLFIPPSRYHILFLSIYKCKYSCNHFSYQLKLIIIYPYMQVQLQSIPS